MNKLKAILIATIVICTFYVYSAKRSCAAGPTIINVYSINEPETWKKADSPYVINRDYLSINATLTIEPGVVVKFKKGAQIDVYSSKLVAKGTQDDRIIFTSLKDDSYGGDTNGDGNATTPAPGDWSRIYLYKSDANIENVSILYGSTAGIVGGALTVNYSDNAVIRDSDIKYSGFCGLYIVDSLPLLERNSISNNNAGIMVYNNSTRKSPTITNSVIVDNNVGAGSTSPSYYQLNAQNNWWGDRSGPYYDSTWNDVGENLDGKGNRVMDGVVFKPWLGSDPLKIRKPLVLVPGIGSSINPDVMIGGILSDDWKMFDHTYDGIIQSFKDMGYIEDEDLFIAYYDWRNSNADSARNYLKPLIQKANTLNGTSKVNVVAHSMGGLVARSYIESDYYNNDVDNLIMLAAPNKGSSDVYAAWEGGYIPRNWSNRSIMVGYRNYLEIKNKATDDYDAIHKYIPSIGELMPLYNYIYPKDNPNDLTNYTAMSEENTFLSALNEKIDLLNQRVEVSIIAGKEQSTTNAIPVVDSDDSNNNLWKDGKPDPIDPEKNDSAGDGRVLLSSAQIQNNFFEALEYGHGEIVSQAEKLVAQRIDETLDNIIDSPQIKDEIVFWFASPVDVEITDPNGKIISSDNVNQIPLAGYAGESKPDGFKIFSIPNPKEGNYNVEVVGNGNGEYHIGSEYADYTGTKEDSSSLVQGEIKLGENKEYKVVYNPLDKNPVEDITSKDTTPPAITASVLPKPNESGWNNANVIVYFDATDDSGKIKSITPDVTISEEGKNQIATGRAEDEAGNIATKTISRINIDKTAPVTKGEVLGTEGRNDWYISLVTINFSATDNLSGIGKTFHALDGADFEDGNELIIDADGDHRVKYYALDLAGNRETEKILNIKIDRTAPEIIFTSPEDKSYRNSEMLPINYAVSDEQNSTDKISTKIFYDEQEIDRDEIDLSLEKLGTHTISAVAIDEAGNVSQKTAIDFTVTTNVDAIVKNVKHYYFLGLIKKMSTKVFLEIKLRNIQEMMKLLDAFESKWMPRWAKEKVVSNLKRNINHQIDDLENQIERNKNFQKTIDEKVREILRDDLEAVKV